LALFKASQRSSGSSLRHCPAAMTELDISYSPPARGFLGN
jgi:hypothetical protein